MAKYRVTLTDRFGVKLGLLQLASNGSSPLGFSNVLNGGGDGTLAAQFDQPLVTGAGGRSRLTGWASEVVVERLSGWGTKGVVAAGPVLKPAANLDSEQLTVPFQPVYAWLGERQITSRLVYPGFEQTEIAGDLITKHTTGLGPDGDIRLGFQHLNTGVRVSQLYLPTDQKTVSQAILDIATAAGGFDFDVRLERAGGRFTRTFVPYYPTKGRKVSQVLTAGRGGLRNFNIEEAGEIATRVTGFGQAKITKTAPAAVESKYGIHQRSMSLTDANSIDKLSRQVLDYLQARTPPIYIVSFSYVVSRSTPYGFIEPGDSVKVKAGKGWADYDDWVRVIGTSTSVDAGGNETVACMAASAEGVG